MRFAPTGICIVWGRRLRIGSGVCVGSRESAVSFRARGRSCCSCGCRSICAAVDRMCSGSSVRNERPSSAAAVGWTTWRRCSYSTLAMQRRSSPVRCLLSWPSVCRPERLARAAARFHLGRSRVKGVGQRVNPPALTKRRRGPPPAKCPPGGRGLEGEPHSAVWRRAGLITSWLQVMRRRYLEAGICRAVWFSNAGDPAARKAPSWARHTLRSQSPGLVRH